MKILLVKPFSPYQKMVVPPLGLAYIASYLEREGYQVKIIDSSALKYKRKDEKMEIKHFNPDIFGVTATSMTLFDALDIIKSVKEYNPNCLTVIGGPHPTVRAKETLKISDYVDVVVRGEGEETFSDLTKKYDKNDRNKFSEVRGISYKENKKIIETGDRPPIENLDSLPFPAYHLLPMDRYKYWDRLFSGFAIKKNGIPFSYMFTSRGCPYNCAFCSSRALWGENWRNRSPENILDELKILNDKYKRKVVDIIDDTFTINKKRVIKLCNLIKKEDLDMSFICTTRVDLFDREIAFSLKKAGFSIVYFGLESGDQKILNYLCKGFSLADSKKAVNTARDAGLKVGSNFILGIPGETKKEIKKTMNFAKQLNLNSTSFTILLPFPGTKIYEDAKKDNLLLTERWDRYTFGNFSSLMKVPGFSNNELKGFYIKAFILCNYTPLKFLKNLFSEFPSRGFVK
jgi:radical SAM superfamily enzyme YgiQ (UPF0313 family)